MKGDNPEREKRERKARAVTACVLGCAVMCAFIAVVITNTWVMISARKTGLPELGGKVYCLCAERGEARVLARVSRGGGIKSGDRLVYKLSGGYAAGYAERVSENGGKRYVVVKASPEGEEALVLPEAAICGRVEETYPELGELIYGVYKYRLGIILCATVLMVYEVTSMSITLAKHLKEKRIERLSAD